MSGRRSVFNKFAPSARGRLFTSLRIVKNKIDRCLARKKRLLIKPGPDHMCVELKGGWAVKRWNHNLRFSIVARFAILNCEMINGVMTGIVGEWVAAGVELFAAAR